MLFNSNLFDDENCPNDKEKQFKKSRTGSPNKVVKIELGNALKQVRIMLFIIFALTRRNEMCYIS